MRYLLLMIVVAAGVFLAGLWQHWEGWPWRDVPRRYNPFAPLHVDDPPSLLTRIKRERIAHDPKACRATLEQARRAGEVAYRAVGSPSIGQCQLHHAVRIRSTSVDFNHSFLASCPLAVAWLRFERHQLQPAARDLFDAPVRHVIHYGSFACRNIYHRKDARRSAHATAEALDIAAFRLADGTSVSVQKNWAKHSDDDRRSRFLHRIHEGACQEFSTVLGPGYNAAHANHFHLGVDGFSVCR
ncbi:extensin family protein [Kushneria phosphatilytica]|uniref:Extensin family protein n=1 Tax=Kushneria phosphatilytica TaxID=657387 RepID=A0A5C0ZXX2_9GAMM|nr:extensin family protein [Kushneria phosphatilytica]QEL10213.1 extensin family protein [Kushneria phosphatilytica]